MKVAAKIVFILLISASLSGQVDTTSNNRLHSAFVMEVIDEVEWPNKSNQDSVAIVVIGDGGFVASLDQAAKSKNSRKVIVKSASVEDNLAIYDIVFIATDSLDHLAKILKKVENLPILTISNHGTFARYGVMIGISDIKDDKINFVINNMTARHSKIKISKDLIVRAVKTFG